MCGCRIDAMKVWGTEKGSVADPKDPSPDCPFCDGTGILKRAALRAE